MSVWGSLSSGLAKYADVSQLKEKAKKFQGQLQEFTQEVLQDIEESEQTAHANVEKFRAEKKQQEDEHVATDGTHLQDGSQQHDHLSSGFSKGLSSHDSSTSFPITSLSDSSFAPESFPITSLSDTETSLLSEAHGHSPSQVQHTNGYGHSTSDYAPSLHTSSPLVEVDASTLIPTPQHQRAQHLMPSSLGFTHGAESTPVAHGHRLAQQQQQHTDDLDGGLVDHQLSSVLQPADLHSSASHDHQQLLQQSHQQQAHIQHLQAALQQAQQEQQNYETRIQQVMQENNVLKQNYETRIQQLLSEVQSRDEAAAAAERNYASSRDELLSELGIRDHKYSELRHNFDVLVAKAQKQAEAREAIAAEAAPQSVLAASEPQREEQNESTLDVRAVLDDVSVAAEEKLTVLAEEIELLQARLKKHPPPAAHSEALAALSSSSADVTASSALSDLQTRIDDLQSELESVTEEKTMLSEIMNELKAESEKSLAEATRQHEVREQQLKEELQRAQELSRNTGAGDATLTTEIGRLELADAQQQVQQLQQQLEAAVQKQQQSQQQLDVQQEQTASVYQQNQYLQQELATAQQQITTLQQQHQQSAYDSNLEGEITRLQAELAAVQEQHRQQVEAAQHTIADLQHQVSDLQHAHPSQDDHPALDTSFHSTLDTAPSLNTSFSSSSGGGDPHSFAATLNADGSSSSNWETQYHALKSSHDKLLSFRLQAVKWKAQAEETMHRLKERKDAMRKEWKEQEKKWQTERRELIGRIQAMKQSQHEGGDAAGGTVPQPSPSAAANSPVLAGVLEATEILQQEHNATLSLVQAKLDLAQQQLSMQTAQIAALQEELRNNSVSASSATDSQAQLQSLEEQLRAEYLPITDELATKLAAARDETKMTQELLREAEGRERKLREELKDQEAAIQMAQTAATMTEQHFQKQLQQAVAQAHEQATMETRQQAQAAFAQMNQTLQETQQQLQQVQTASHEALQQAHAAAQESARQYEQKLAEAMALNVNSSAVAALPAADDSVLADLRNQVSALSQSESAWSSRYEQLLSSFTNLQARCRDGLEGEEGNMKTIAELRAAMQQAQTAHEALQGECDRLKAELKKGEKAQGELMIMTARWREASSEADGLRSLMKAQVEAMSEAREAAEAENGGTSDPSAQAVEIQALRQQIRNLQLDAAAMGSLQSDYAGLQKNYELLQLRSEEWKQTLDDTRSAMADVQAKLEQTEMELQRARESRAAEVGVGDAASAEATSQQVQELQQALHHKSKQLAELQRWTSALELENAQVKKNFEASVTKLKNFSTEDDLVDRRLVVKMLVTFFERREKDEVISLMAKVLQFSKSDLEKINAGRRGVLGSIVGTLLGGGGGSDSNVPSTPTSASDANLSDKWIEFLMQESEKGDAQTATQRPATTASARQPDRPTMFGRESEFEAPSIVQTHHNQSAPVSQLLPRQPMPSLVQQPPPQPLPSPPSSLLPPPPISSLPPAPLPALPLFQVPPPNFHPGAPQMPPAFPPMPMPMNGLPPLPGAFAVPPPFPMPQQAPQQ